MKFILSSLFVLSFNLFSQTAETLIYDIKCFDQNEVLKVDIVLDMETGEQGYFKQYFNGEENLYLYHVESDPEGMTVEGAILEIYAQNDEIESFSRLSLSNPTKGEVVTLDGQIAYSENQTIKYNNSLVCKLRNI